MPVRSGWLSHDGQSREDTRLVSLGALTPTSPVATRSGVLPGSSDGQSRISGFTVDGVAGTMSATVHPGRAVVQGADAQGAYPVALAENQTLTFADGDAQYHRIDLVVLRVYDDAYDGSGRTEAVIEIVRGTPAATPAVPATPAVSIPLYEVVIATKASAGTGGIAWASALTGRRTATVGVGGILPVTTDTSNGAYPGQYRDLGGQLQRWTGTAWADYPVLPAWQSWTPAWTTNTGNALPSYGNAVVSGRYLKHGRTVHANFTVVFGTTTTYGTSPTASDNWRFSLPVPASAAQSVVGFAELAVDNTSRIVSRVQIGTTGTFELVISTGRSSGAALANTGLVDALSPWTWASGNSLLGTLTYEAAA
ncbi:hypothetical protein JCM4814A_20670 [Streptomyces phaeofaciens JCM 4814]|uniref:Uncharacterized protein n=1 Tax=Streptomyces phaeofaciens TaxID=68254 RepID=A0A918HGA4_9ACTN|nr:hypothetical protein [Streptomyces phaeofaciens]GGT56203.1 hypothetical protein GCM10010226_36700 [Streptomyces phaeofaciens]